jgi:phosphate transport system permease protein
MSDLGSPVEVMSGTAVPGRMVMGSRSRAVAARTPVPARTSARRLRADRIARWAVSGGGLAIIASILGIFVFILAEIWPLTAGGMLEVSKTLSLPGRPMRAMVSDEYRTHVAGLDAAGALTVVRLADGQILSRHSVAPLARGGDSGAAVGITHVTSPPRSNLLAAATTDGRVVLVGLEWQISFDGDARRVEPGAARPVLLEIDALARPIRTFAAQGEPDGTAVVAAQLADGSLAVVSRAVTTNPFSGAVTETLTRSAVNVPVSLRGLVLDAERRHLYGASEHGELLWWQLRDGKLSEPQIASAGGSPVTALSLLLGQRALVAGHADGGLSVWFPAAGDGNEPQLTRIREFAPQGEAIAEIYPSARDRSFLALDRAGGLGLYHSTAERVLWWRAGLVPGATGLLFSPKADAAYVASADGITAFDVVNPHPETTLRTLFAKVWYEGYGAPAYVWQSTGGEDTFEPKFSLTPLLLGTLKGTVYSLLLAIPLGVFGAMYASQFMHPRYRNVVKPMVEIMAALPSVVLGFLAGLWLAPRLERTFAGLLLMVVVLPLVVLAAGALWQRLPMRLRSRLASGGEAFVFVGVIGAGIWLCVLLSPAVETLAFGGNFQRWLREALGFTYDQRNAVVVGLAMGFAVIPIIFSVSEDAFSSVPLSLISGSLALGATRWQTVTRVVLPTASPGIFSAVMIGFGRAVGETMIVLMATGNTPILDWSPFNGFRTLSANIAVEIPEAPQYGTLYRVLFLAALLLFLFTFVVNTAAEIVRQRLRRRYGHL